MCVYSGKDTSIFITTTLTYRHCDGPQKFGPHHNDDMMTALFSHSVEGVSIGLGQLGGPLLFRMRLGSYALKTPNVATHRPNAAIRHTVALATSCSVASLLTYGPVLTDDNDLFSTEL